jgi:hypothetical protein
LSLYGRFGYVEMKRFFIIKIRHLCRSSTGLQLCSVYGRRFSAWRTTTSLQRCLHGWGKWPRILLPNMGGCIIEESYLQTPRVLFRFRSYLFVLLFYHWVRTWTAVCIPVMQRPGVLFKLE